MMKKIVSTTLLLLLGCSMALGQSATANATLNEIRSFEKSTLAVLSRPFNVLRDDVYGHFYRSQNTLRIARQALFSSASKFPFYSLTDEMRRSLVTRLTSIIIDVIDPTVDYLQKDSMLRYNNFMKETTPIETSVKLAVSRLQELKEAIGSANDDACLRRENINVRRLTTIFTPAITAVNDCTRNASATYRAPINEFTRVHFIALPFINRIVNDLNQCSFGNQEDCVQRFLSRYCEAETCAVSSTITEVKTQAETMVDTVQKSFEECLMTVASKLPEETPFLANIRKCQLPVGSVDSNAV